MKVIDDFLSPKDFQTISDEILLYHNSIIVFSPGKRLHSRKTHNFMGYEPHEETEHFYFRGDSQNGYLRCAFRFWWNFPGKFRKLIGSHSERCDFGVY